MDTLLLYYTACTLICMALAFWRPPRLPRYNLLLAIAAVPQAGSILGVRIPAMFLVSVVAFGAWCLCNRAIAGVPVVALGVMLNLLVMASYGGAMPIHADVLAGLGYAAPAGSLLAGSKDVVVESTYLTLLSEWIVVPGPIVASPGDLIAVAGIVYWLLFSHPGKERNSNDAISRHLSPA
jgi:hypothetical protein